MLQKRSIQETCFEETESSVEKNLCERIFSGLGMGMCKRKKTIQIIAAFLCAAIVISAGSFILSYKGLTVSHYEVKSAKLSKEIRIVNLTDLHNSSFGKENRRLIAKVAKQQPDLIVLTGDLVNQNDEQMETAVSLISALCEVAPVYVSFGNHEKAYERRYNIDVRQLYSQAGATVLEFDWDEIEINGQQLRIGGLYGYCLSRRYLGSREADELECDFLTDFEATTDMKILLCHMPFCWIRLKSLDDWNIDCVLCGHVHGGQIRLPFIGGLWAPDEGWFPGRESGLYWSKDGSHVMGLSRGLGSTEEIPRFNNIPEIFVLDLMPET